MTAIQQALFELNKQIVLLLDNDVSVDDKDILKALITCLKVGCGCDNYNGYDCGCSRRAGLAESALIEIEKL